MEQPKLGVPPETGAGRDAVHVAILPVLASRDLWPGERVGVVHDGTGYCTSKNAKKIGIVDPFLENRVKAGERFYLCLPPRTVTSLTHQWTHPDVPEVDRGPVEERDS